MITGSIARRWAKALFSLAEQDSSLATVVGDVKKVADLWDGSGELQDAMTNPMLSLDVRRAIFTELINKTGVSRTVQNFCNLLIDKGRLTEVSGIYRELQLLADRKSNRIRAEVTSAGPLSDAVVSRLKSTLESATKKTVVLTRSEDPGLIGGIVTKVGGLMYDGSIRTQLGRIKEDMRRG